MEVGVDFVKPTVDIYINDARIMKLYRTSGPNAIKISGENTGITFVRDVSQPNLLECQHGS